MICLVTMLLGAALGPDAAAPGGAAPLPTRAVSATNAAIEREYQKVVSQDDAAQAEVDQWVREANELKAKGAGGPDGGLERRIRERFAPVRRSYEEFLGRHPTYAQAHLAYGNFLNDRQDEPGAQAQWEKVLELDPKNAAACNNLAGVYSEHGPVKQAFEFFTKAIELSPAEAMYYHNFADSLCVLSKRAAKLYGVTEQQVYAKAALLYSNAARLEPRNFTFASDAALVFYSLKPLPAPAALGAWTNALKAAQDETQREEVYVHLARVKMLAGRLAEARTQLNAVTNAHFATLKTNLLRALAQREPPP